MVEHLVPEHLPHRRDGFEEAVVREQALEIGDRAVVLQPMQRGVVPGPFVERIGAR